MGTKSTDDLTAEQQLHIALVRICSERGVELSADPEQSVQIPLKGGGTLEVPDIFA